MRPLKFPIWSLLVLALCENVIAIDYYIDYAAGSNTNSGTSPSKAWKTHPYMQGFSGSYSHGLGLQDTVVYTGSMSDTSDDGSVSSTGLKALSIGAGQVVFTDSAGASSVLTFDVSVGHVATEFVGSEFWIAGLKNILVGAVYEQFVVLNCYSLTGSPPSSYTLLTSKTLANVTDFQLFNVRAMQSGSAFVVLHSTPMVEGPPGHWPKTFAVYYLNGGVWTTNMAAFTVDSTHMIQALAPNEPLIEQPSDNTLWGFYNRDSSANIDAFTITESLGSYSVVSRPTLISSAVGDSNLNRVNGELSKIYAQPDGTTIRLAYVRYGTDFFTNLWRGQEVTMCNVTAAAAKSFSYGVTNLDVYSGLGDPPAMLISGSSIYHFYRPIVASPQNVWMPNQLWLNNGSSWVGSATFQGSAPALGKVHQLPGNNGIYYYASAESKLHLLTLATNVGDRFIFKGGVTWPNSCFTMSVLAGGLFGKSDYYGVDSSWYSGAAWSKPVWDAQATEFPGGYDVMVLFNLAAHPDNVIIDNIDMTRLYWTGPKSYSWVSYVNLSVSSNIVMQNCAFRNWSHGTYAAGTRDDLKVVIGANSSPYNPGCIITNALIDGENLANSTDGTSSGEATYAYSGNVINSTIKNCISGPIVTGNPASNVPQIVSGCDVGPTYMSFDSGAHPDGIFNNGGHIFYWYNNYFHNNRVLSIFTGNGSGAEHSYIWNNVVWGGPNNSPIVIDTPYAGGQIFVWNNTLVGDGFAGVRVANRGHGALGVLDLRNNLIVSSVGAYSLDAGAAITSLTNSSNTLLTPGQASVLGYTAANRWKPTSSGAPTVGAGADLSALLGGVLTTDILGVTRPSGSTWDTSAYEFYLPGTSPGVLSMTVSAQSVSQNGGSVVVTAARSGGTQGAVSVTAATSNGTATAGHDYTATTATLTWLNGTTGARSFTVPILASGDTATTNRTFTVTLSGPTGGATLGTPVTDTVTIVMNRPPPPPPSTNGGVIAFTQPSWATTETNGTVTLSVTRVNGTNAPVSVAYGTANGSATAGVDYTTATGALSWTANENATKTFTVPIINSGATGPPRFFYGQLSSPLGGASLGLAQALVNIMMTNTISTNTGFQFVGKISLNGSLQAIGGLGTNVAPITTTARRVTAEGDVRITLEGDTRIVQ